MSWPKLAHETFGGVQGSVGTLEVLARFVPGTRRRGARRRAAIESCDGKRPPAQRQANAENNELIINHD